MEELLKTITQGGSIGGVAGIWTLVIAVVGYIAKEVRENRKLSSEDRQANREGFTSEVASLRVENRTLRHEVDEQRALTTRENAAIRNECRVETDELRAEIKQLRVDLAECQRAATGRAALIARADRGGFGDLIGKLDDQA